MLGSDFGTVNDSVIIELLATKTDVANFFAILANSIAHLLRDHCVIPSVCRDLPSFYVCSFSIQFWEKKFLDQSSDAARLPKFSNEFCLSAN